MRLKKIYIVIYHGLDDEQRLLKAYDREEAAEEDAERLGHSEIHHHSVEEIFLQEE